MVLIVPVSSMPAAKSATLARILVAARWCVT
jgi:hypothetical protein